MYPFRSFHTKFSLCLEGRQILFDFQFFCLIVSFYLNLSLPLSFPCPQIISIVSRFSFLVSSSLSICSCSSPVISFPLVLLPSLPFLSQYLCFEHVHFLRIFLSAFLWHIRFLLNPTFLIACPFFLSQAQSPFLQQKWDEKCLLMIRNDFPLFTNSMKWFFS